tara:strand:- start:48 stop:407 length:360 start_codon:yes stop_codon:yes gene_type:complete
MKLITTQEQREQIKKHIQTELLKRGFTAKITRLEEVKCRLEFETEKFQTTPVIFESIFISNFSSSITKKTNEDKNIHFHRVWIQVNVVYNHFDSGANTCNLFTFYGDLHDGHVFNLVTK